MLVAPNYLAFYLPKPYHYSLRIQILLNSNLPTIVHGHFGSILPLHNPRCGPIDPFAFVMQKSLIVTLGIQNFICSRSKMQHNGDDMGLCEIIIHSHNQDPTPERSAPFHATSFLWAKIPPFSEGLWKRCPIQRKQVLHTYWMNDHTITFFFIVPEPFNLILCSE